jgi:hypothetical protein
VITIVHTRARFDKHLSVSMLLSDLRPSCTSIGFTSAGTFWSATMRTMSQGTSEVAGRVISPPSRKTTTWSGSRPWIDAEMRDVVNSCHALKATWRMTKAMKAIARAKLDFCGFGFPKGFLQIKFTWASDTLDNDVRNKGKGRER